MKACSTLATALALVAFTFPIANASAQEPKPQMGGELVLTGQLDKTMFPGRNPMRAAWMSI